LQLQVGRVVVLAEKDANLFAQYVGLLLQKKVDVPQRNVLDFWL
jgi:hypothetical protein